MILDAAQNLLNLGVLGAAGVHALASGDYAAILRLVPRDPAFLVALGVGAVIVSLAIGGFQWFVQMRDKAKGVPFAELIKGAAGLTPVIADPAKRARLDDLRRKFEDGVEKFRAAGKDLYSLPWYLLVGPAGSGKTEALRHCNVGFPPGLQDYLQGAGGTLNMHWWFTNHAVVLDTAGRIFMEEIATGGDSGEWGEFLKLLKRYRPNQPVNGMFLVIGADSLIRDKSEEIESKAGRIAQQLDAIQRTLDVRFPVFVIITKCDLIAGFREFFDNVYDPNLQHQLLGWSNPDSLDSPLRIELVEQHMTDVRKRLLSRRLALIADTTRYAQGSGKRLDEVDELFALPDNLEKIVPRLRRYLEMIFAGGEWSPKPLFLRGIYFTSSMREGEALDQDLARALGLSLDSLPGGKVWDKERSFFLRDVFLSKAFKEKGLVTRATNVQKQQSTRRFALLGSAAAAAALVLGFTFFGQSQLSKSVEGPRAFWRAVGEAVGVVKPEVAAAGTEPEGQQATQGDVAIVRYEAPSWVYAGDRADIRLPDAFVPRAALPTLTAQRAVEPVRVPWIFSPAAALGGGSGGFVAEQRQAHAGVLERAILVPLIDAARQHARESATWTSASTAALAELIRLETLKAGLVPAGGPRASLVDLRALLRVVVPGSELPNEVRLWQDAIESTFATGTTSDGRLPWPAPSLRVGEVAAQRAIREGLDRFANSWTTRAQAEEFALGRLALLADALGAFRAEEARLLSLRGMPGEAGAKTSLVATSGELESYSSQLRAHLEAMKAAATRADALLAAIKESPASLSAGLEATRRDAIEQINSEYALLLAQLPAVGEGDTTREPSGLAEMRQQIASRRESAEKAIDQVASRVSASLAPLLSVAAAGPAGRESDLAYRVRLAAYERGAAELADASAGPETAWYLLSERFTDLDRRLQRAEADLEQIARGLADPAARPTLMAAAGSVARTARAARASAALQGFLSKLPENADGVAGVVETIARERNAAPTRLPALPLTDAGESTIDIRFAPGAAAAVLEGLTRAEAELASGVVDRERLLAEVRARARGLEEYARQYAQAWTSGAVRALSLSASLQSWRELAPVLSKIETAGSPEAAAALRSFAAEAIAAVEPLPPSVRALPEVKGAVDRLSATLRALSDESLVRARADALGTLATLADKPWPQARGTLLTPGSGRGPMDALGVLTAGTSRVVYDESIALGVLRALRADYEPEARKALDLIVASDRWPLNRAGDVAKGLTPDELRRVLAATRLLSGGSVAPRGLSDEAAGLVSDLSGGRVLSDEQRRGVERVGAVAGALGAGLEQNQPVTASMVPIWSRREIDALPTLASVGVGSAGDAVEWFEQMEVVREGEPPLPRVALRGIDAARAAELVKQLTVASPGPGVAIRLYRNFGDDQPTGEVRLVGPWSAAELVLLPGARASAPGGTIWQIPLPVVERDTKQVYHLWMNLTFSTPLPRAEDWPSARTWPRP